MDSQAVPCCNSSRGEEEAMFCAAAAVIAIQRIRIGLTLKGIWKKQWTMTGESFGPSLWPKKSWKRNRAPKTKRMARTPKKDKSKAQYMLDSDEKLQRQGQIGDLFAGALTSIFKSKQPPEPSSETSIFAGDLVGGAHYIAKANQEKSFSSSSDAASKEGMPIFDDPFVSEAELPLLIPKTTIDKHRWAHEIPYIEPGAVLIANEKLGGVFHQTVVLIIEHYESTGTFGVVINRPMQGNLQKIGSEPTSKVDLSLKMAFKESSVTYGGPVLTEEFSVLHSFGEVEGARKLCPGVYIGGSEELMAQVRSGAMDPHHALFVKGHAAWVPGQLNREIGKGVWYTAAVSSDFILRYAGVELTPEDNPNDLWTDILQCMGGKYEEIARRHGGTGDSRRVLP
mmetsp:Transcript_8709/g.18849  ORF Transcript_8709/g.18849 Transcript_8709/m.18849 type:complete len:396 (-) Transcript_8709:317-1504(-)